MKNIKSNKLVLFIALFSFIFLGFKIINEKYMQSGIETLNLNENNKKKYVYPFGKIVGVKADTDGVLVVGYEENDVEYIGSIKRGDNIVKINGQKIKNTEQVKEILKESKEDKIEVVFERDNKYLKENLKLKKENGKSKLGLWVRDKISGIGTVTFYDQENDKFKAIGHAITDVDTNELLRIKQGYIYNPTSLKIIKGNDNKVGHIKGEFSTESPIGKFSENSNFGISGNMIGKKNKFTQLIEVGNSKDVKLGKAYILFEDENRNITSYDIEIKSILSDKNNDRDMVIQVIDPKLIDYTGGIVQGMSGSPIIQDNKIIGAITHVFKDNPKKGYGIFINEMIELDKRY
ncbi:SpoIVB peptidase S55 domain-containing protein [Faecalimicrobium sp. JNUCC 81]